MPKCKCVGHAMARVPAAPMGVNWPLTSSSENPLRSAQRQPPLMATVELHAYVQVRAPRNGTGAGGTYGR
jgi:hypothetical protein